MSVVYVVKNLIGNAVARVVVNDRKVIIQDEHGNSATIPRDSLGALIGTLFDTRKA